jgi:hypothetical protein
VAGALLVSRLRVGQRMVVVMYLAWGLTAGGLLGFALTPGLPVALLSSLVVNGALAVGAVLWGSVVQSGVPPRYVARVFGFDWVIAQAATPLSFLAASLGAQASDASTAVAFAALLGAVSMPLIVLARAARVVTFGEGAA